MALNNLINAPVPFSVANGGTGATTHTQYGFMYGDGTSPVQALGALSTGQIIYGQTGGASIAVTFVAGTNMDITLDGTDLVFTADTGAMSFVTATTDQAIAFDTEIMVTGGSLVTLTLPSSASLGDKFEVYAMGTTTGQTRIAQNAGQSIVGGTESTTAGVSGYVESTLPGDTMIVECIDATSGAEVFLIKSGAGQYNFA